MVKGNKMKEKELGRHFFKFNNDSEHLCLESKFMDNGDGIEKGFYILQRLILQGSYNSAEFNLWDIIITPEKLRQLANEMEIAIYKAKLIPKTI
jgi:hypothetical protein